MSLPDNAYTQLTSDLRICRLLNGMWQVSGAHGVIHDDKAIDTMIAYHNAGLTTWDLADHYGPAEDFMGQFRQRLKSQYGDEALKDVQAFTKWVPQPEPVDRKMVRSAIERSRERMQTPVLDMVQFHWWEYRFPGYMDALKYMTDLLEEGLLRHIGLTNFDTKHIEEITKANIPILTNQVQYSIIDRRPEIAMVPLMKAHNMYLLAYGTVCGGLLTDRYLGQPEPMASQLTTASLRKYKQMIDLWGGWNLFQSLLETLRKIADKHNTDIANIAIKYILDKPQVAGVIIGVRLGVSDHAQNNVKTFSLELDADDRAQIDAFDLQANDLFVRIGDCGDEYRRR